MSQAPKDTSEVPRESPWQIMLTGPSLEQIDAAARQALERILELFTDVRVLVVQTTAGDVKSRKAGFQ
jgi:flavin-binding protein dodecin